VLRKIQFPLSVIALVAMIFVWKTVILNYLPNTSFGLSNVEQQTISVSVIKIKGNALRGHEGQKRPLRPGETITMPMTIYTASDSQVILGYGENYASKIKIGPLTTMDLTRLSTNQNELNDSLYVYIHKGIVLFKIFNPQKKKVLQVKTSTMSMGIRGTTFAVESAKDKSILLVHEGAVEVLSSKSKPEMAHAGQGFEAQHENRLKEVSASDYKIDWSFEGDVSSTSHSTTMSGSSNLSLSYLLEREIKRLHNNFDEIKNKKPLQLQEIAEKEKALDSEIALINNDILCLQSMMKECEFTSEHFKNDVANLRNNPTRLTNNPSIKINLEKEMEKAKSDITQNKNSLKNEVDIIEAQNISEQSRLNEVLTKYEQYKAADENGKKTLLKEIAPLLRSPELHEEINKIGI